MTGTGEILEGRYEVGAQIGLTDAGRKFEGRDRKTGTPVFVYFLTNESAQSRLVREGTVVSSLKSPHTIRLFSFGRTESGEPYAVTEAYQGETLTEYMRRAGPLDPDGALNVATQVLQSLAEAHDQGIAHGAVTPGRIVDTGGVVRLDGIGFYPPLVEGSQNEAWRDQTYDDSHRYAAPEMFDGSNFFSPSTDIFAVGVITRELITGRGPAATGPYPIPPQVGQWLEALEAQDPNYRARDASQALKLLGIDSTPAAPIDEPPPSLQSAELALDSGILEEVRLNHSYGDLEANPQPVSAQLPEQDLPPLKRGFDLRGALEDIAGTVVVVIAFLLLVAIAVIAFLAPFFLDMISQAN